MKLILGEEQQQLRSVVADFLAGASPLVKVRQVAESSSGHDPALWRRMAGELGLTGLAVPERFGGSGFGMAEQAVVVEELGAALTPSPYLASAVLAAHTLLALDDEAAAKELLPDIAAGSVIATLAAPYGSGFAGAPGVRAVAGDGGGHLLTGSVPYVLSGSDTDMGAGLVLVVAELSGRPAVFAVDGAAGGLSWQPLTTLDLTRPQARLVLEDTPGRLIPCAEPERALARAYDLACVALAAEQLGVIRACLAAILDYAKIRVQFGRYVGSFQAVKHRLADMHCVLEQAESMVRYAAWAADEAPEELPAAAALAQTYLGPACFRVAKDHLLLHGGIGFTWEHDAHLYYKRAKTDEVLLGPPREHRRRLADRLGV